MTDEPRASKIARTLFIFGSVILVLVIGYFTLGNNDLQPAEAAPQEQAAFIAPANTATIYVRPTATPDLALMATATAAQVRILEAQAQQEALALEVAQSQATLAAYPLMATQTQAALDVIRVTQSAQETQTARTAQALATRTAYAPTQRAIERAEAAAPMWTVIRMFTVVCVMACIVMFCVYGFRALSYNLEKRKELDALEIENERQQMTPDAPMIFEEAAPGAYVRKPAISPDSERRVAEYVNKHGWNDDMRGGAGVGLSHPDFVRYRQYLVQIGVLRMNGNRFDVVKPEYFAPAS